MTHRISRGTQTSHTLSIYCEKCEWFHEFKNYTKPYLDKIKYCLCCGGKLT